MLFKLQIAIFHFAICTKAIINCLLIKVRKQTAHSMLQKLILQFYSKNINNLHNMYIILVYDIGEKRVGKMLKLCRKYLNWIQNSVFEGEISEVRLKEMLSKAKLVIDETRDSIIIFSSRDEKWLDKQIVGKELSKLDNIL